MSQKKLSLRRQPQQQRSQQRVEQILDAAAVVFDEVGFEAATTHAIAARANTAVGSLYQFFPNKLAIFNALELRHLERVYRMWDKLSRPEIVRLPFADFVRTIVSNTLQLFEQPTSRIVFLQFFTAPSIFRNIDDSLTEEAIQFMAKLIKGRNSDLNDHRAALLAEVCVNASNTLILLALRSKEPHRRAIIVEIEALLRAYLKADLGDEAIATTDKSLSKLTEIHNFNFRQKSILAYAIEHQEITINDCQNLFPQVSRRTLQRDIKNLGDRNFLLSHGHTDRRSYSINPAKLNR